MNEVMPKYLQHGPDGPLIGYWRSQLAEMRELRAIDPKDCVAFLFPAPTDSTRLAKHLSPVAVSDDYARMTALLLAAAEHPSGVASKAEIQPALLQAIRHAESVVPGGMQLLAQASRDSPRPAALCNASLAFYDEILTLPPREAGSLLRYLVASEAAP